MSGVYSDEYQFHYWALVGKLTIDDESISIAVPLVMFNYPQKVTGGSVDFDLKDVEKMSEETRELAELKAKELTPFIQEVTENVGVQEWQIVPTMTCHTHPGRMNSFSGTDYCKDLDEPGICHPLSVGVNQPSFSSIVCHSGTQAELVHTEFRIFNGDDEKKEYTYGTCMTYVKAEEKQEETQSPLDAVLQRNIPKPNKPYYFKDRLPGDEGKDFLMELANMFEKVDYDVDTSLILEENVQKHVWGRGKGKNGGDDKSYWDKYWANDGDDESEKIYTATKMKKDLVDSGLYTYPELYMIDNLTEIYDAFLQLQADDEVEVVVSEPKKNPSQAAEETEKEYWKKMNERDKMVSEMLASGFFRVQDFAGLEYEGIESMYEEFLKDE